MPKYVDTGKKRNGKTVWEGPRGGLYVQSKTGGYRHSKSTTGFSNLDPASIATIARIDPHVAATIATLDKRSRNVVGNQARFARNAALESAKRWRAAPIRSTMLQFASKLQKIGIFSHPSSEVKRRARASGAMYHSYEDMDFDVMFRKLVFEGNTPFDVMAWAGVSDGRKVVQLAVIQFSEYAGPRNPRNKLSESTLARYGSTFVKETNITTECRMGRLETERVNPENFSDAFIKILVQLTKDIIGSCP